MRICMKWSDLICMKLFYMKYRGDAISRVFQKLWVKSSLQVLYETVEKKIVKSRRLWFHKFFRGFGSNHFYKFFSKLLPKKISWNRIDLWFREFFRNFGSNHFYKFFSKLLLKKNSWNRVENFSDTSSESFMFLCRFYYDVITCFSIHSKLVKRQGQKMHC